MDAQEDARAAVRYLRSMAADPQWRLDSDRIAVGGDSAGAWTALFYAFVKLSKEGNSGNPGWSSKIQTAISISGELKDEAFCNHLGPLLQPKNCSVEGTWDFTDDVDNSPGQPPVLMVHGTADLTVPYVNGRAVAQRASATGVPNKLITIPNGGHVPMEALLSTPLYLEQFTSFLYGSMDLAHAECPASSRV